ADLLNEALENRVGRGGVQLLMRDCARQSLERRSLEVRDDPAGPDSLDDSGHHGIRIREMRDDSLAHGTPLYVARKAQPLRKLLISRDSCLTVRAVVRGALPLRDLSHGRAAHAAWFPSAFVYVELLSEVAGRSIRTHVVAQRCATDLDGHRQHRAHGTRQL